MITFTDPGTIFGLLRAVDELLLVYEPAWKPFRNESVTCRSTFVSCRELVEEIDCDSDVC